MRELIDSLEHLIEDPSRGLPEEVFLLVSRITPLINVDLLIKNEAGQILLTWRDDRFGPPGWHIPGGIIRYKEKISDRINAVAEDELGASVRFGEAPLAVNEVLVPSRRDRGHTISLLYECSLISPPDQALRYRKGAPRRGEWAWHERCPDNLIPVHDMYREYLP